MRKRVFFIVILASFMVAIQSRSNVCNVSIHDRRECGFWGINEITCIDKGCCWESIEGNDDNIPYCYQSNHQMLSNDCANFNALEKKVNCGYYGIIEDECINIGPQQQCLASHSCFDVTYPPQSCLIPTLQTSCTFISESLIAT